jgi:hypothetical protein
VIYPPPPPIFNFVILPLRFQNEATVYPYTVM